MWGGVPGGYRNTINDNLVPILMIETLEGLKNADAIAKVPGVTAIFAASGDLGNFSGYKQDDPDYERAINIVHDAAIKAGVKLCGPFAPAEFVAAAPADGYTLMMGTIGAMAINVSLYKNVRFDPLKDFVPVARMVSFSNVLVVRSSFPINSVKELIDYAKARPDALRYGSPGVGGSPHMAMVMFDKMAATRLVHVPYKGASPALNDLMGGHIDLAFSDPLLTLSHLSGGRIRALAVSGPIRLKSAPSIPTVAEAGLPGYNVTGWLGFVALRGTPDARIRLLNAATNEALAMPDIQAKLTDMGADVIPGTPQEFGELIRSEHARWKAVIQEQKLAAD